MPIYSKIRSKWGYSPDRGSTCEGLLSRGRERCVLRGAADFSRRRVLETSADEVCDLSAVRIAVRRERELGREGEMIGHMATTVGWQDELAPRRVRRGR